MVLVVCLFFAAFFCQFMNEASPAKSSAENYDDVLRSLNVSQLNISTLKVLLHRLRLDNCGASDENITCGDKCLTPHYLYKVNGWKDSTVINPSLFQDLSSALLYFLLPEKNAGQFVRWSENCQDGVPHGISYEQFLQYYGTNGLICERFLDRILRDINGTFNDRVTKQCFSAVDVFNKLNLSKQHGDLSKEHFPQISVVVVSNLIRGQCIKTSRKHDVELPCNSYFITNLVAKFGDNAATIPVQGFEEILDSIGIGNSRHDGVDHHHDHFNPTNQKIRKRRNANSVNTYKISDLPRKCFSPHNLLDIFSVNESAGMNVEEFQQICPSLIQQVVFKSCVKTSEEKTRQTDKYVWAYGFVAVLVISLLSLAGIAVIPTMKAAVYKKVIIVLVGLAIGTLAGDALLHLIPHAAGFHAESHDASDHAEEDKTFIWKFLVVASGVYGFFLFETFTHLFLRSGGHGHSHSIEHTRKHSPFERNNSCRTMERHELRGLGHNPLPDNNAENTQVIYNKSSESPDKSTNKLDVPDEHKHHDHEQIPNLLRETADGERKSISSVGWMIIIGDTIHNITDGIAIGAAFSEDLGGGISTAIAVFCHELPHELGDFAVLISSGMTVKQALFANFCSACSSFIGLVIGILIGERTESGSQWVFAVMGGMFLYIALVDMLPELMHSEELGGAGRYQIFLLQNLGMLSGFVIMFFIAFYEKDLVLPV